MADELRDLKDKLQLAEQRVERYRVSRDTAENLLEQKASELYEVNLALQLSRDNLQQEIYQATYELQASNTRLQRALDDKSTFIGSISHEIRTPLNAVVGLSELLLESEMSADQEQYVKTIFNSSATLVKLLNSILHISKIEAGKVELQTQPCDLSAMLASLCHMFQAESIERGTTLTAVVDESVPQWIQVDEGRTGQIITNLVSNAIKNTEDGKIDIFATAEKLAENKFQLHISVTDTGIGIDEKQIKRIFSAYEQFGNLDQGVGLGLAICRQLTDVMGGTLKCSSTLGEGSIFELSIPVEKTDQSNIDDKTDVLNDDFDHLNVLIAEDNSVNQQVIRAQFAQLGLIPMIVSDGEQALMALEKNRFDIVFLDIQMPVKDGEQTIKELRKGNTPYANIFAAALTAASFGEKKERMLALGFNEFISKPVTLDNLRKTLAKAAKYNPNVIENEPESSPDLATKYFSYQFFEEQFGESAEAVFTQIASVFLEHSYKEIDALKVAAEQTNINQIRKLSHSLKGALASIGDKIICAELIEIEKEPDNAATQHRVELVESKMLSLRKEIEALLHRPA